jgi:hypothetical protein
MRPHRGSAIGATCGSRSARRSKRQTRAATTPTSPSPRLAPQPCQGTGSVNAAGRAEAECENTPPYPQPPLGAAAGPPVPEPAVLVRLPRLGGYGAPPHPPPRGLPLVGGARGRRVPPSPDEEDEFFKISHCKFRLNQCKFISICTYFHLHLNLKLLKKQRGQDMSARWVRRPDGSDHNANCVLRSTQTDQRRDSNTSTSMQCTAQFLFYCQIRLRARIIVEPTAGYKQLSHHL